MNNEATKPASVTARGPARERKEPSAPGEGPSKALSDRGSTPLDSTMMHLSELEGVTLVVTPIVFMLTVPLPAGI